MKKEIKSLKEFEARVRHAKDTNAIGFTLKGIKPCDAVEIQLSELNSTGVINKIVNGSPVTCYF